MIYTALQDTPIQIDLTQVARDSGWSVDGTLATHQSCNAGYVYLLNYPLIIGQQYQYTYQIISISGGYVQAYTGAQYTTPQWVTETITANSTQFYFYSNANCAIDDFSTESIQAITSYTAQNTISFSEKTDKWQSFYTYIPDNAFSLYTDTFSFYQGVPYLHGQGSYSRGNFYGVQYPAIINISSNEQPTRVKTFIGLNYQANELLISPSIQTSLGQQSQLFAGNYLQATYNDGSQVYSNEGMYKASFLRDMNVDLVNGPPLKGNWLTMELQTTSPSTPLALYTTEINYAHSFQGIR